MTIGDPNSIGTGGGRLADGDGDRGTDLEQLRTNRVVPRCRQWRACSQQQCRTAEVASVVSIFRETVETLKVDLEAASKQLCRAIPLGCIV